jgi:hypothetical protein
LQRYLPHVVSARRNKEASRIPNLSASKTAVVILKGDTVALRDSRAATAAHRKVSSFLYPPNSHLYPQFLFADICGKHIMMASTKRSEVRVDTKIITHQRGTKKYQQIGDAPIPHQEDSSFDFESTARSGHRVATSFF